MHVPILHPVPARRAIPRPACLLAGLVFCLTTAATDPVAAPDRPRLAVERHGPDAIEIRVDHAPPDVRYRVLRSRDASRSQPVPWIHGEPGQTRFLVPIEPDENGFFVVEAQNGSVLGSVRLRQGVLQPATASFPPHPPILELFTGNFQTSLPGQPLQEPLVARVAGPGERPVAGEPVLFRVVEGAGTLGPGTGKFPAPSLTVLSDPEGLAPAWFRSPPVPGSISVIAVSLPLRSNAPATIHFSSVTTNIPPIPPRLLAVDCGWDHSLALQADGTILAWGGNHHGQLGQPRRGPVPRPEPVRGLTDVVEIAAANFHSVARTADGTVWVWGNQCCGQAGDGSTADANPDPRLVPGLPRIAGIAAGGHRVLARDESGKVWYWGDYTLGRTNDAVVRPVPKAGVSNVTTLAAGPFHTLARRRDGAVFHWGPAAADDPGPHPPSLLQFPADPIALAAGFDLSLALLSDRTVWQWTRLPSPPPARIVQLSNVVAIALEEATACAFTKDGSVWQWNSAQPVPTRVASVPSARLLSCGPAHFVISTGDSSLIAWGQNAAGQLGDGTLQDRLSPVTVLTPFVLARADALLEVYPPLR